MNYRVPAWLTLGLLLAFSHVALVESPAPFPLSFGSIATASLMVGGAGVVARRAERPFAEILLLVSLFCFQAGNWTYQWLESRPSAIIDGVGFPSRADALFLLTYPLFGIALVLLARSTPWSAADGRAAVAGAAVGGFVLWRWQNFIQVTLDAGLDTNTEVVSIAYPVLGAALISVAVYVVLSERSKQTVVACGAAAAFVVGDAIYNHELFTGTYVVGSAADFFWLLSFVLVGVVAHIDRRSRSVGSYAAQGEDGHFRTRDVLVSGGR